MTRFGFGCMRLPMQGGDVDRAQFSQMIDRYMEAGFRYFDTAHGYLRGRSETAIRECLVSRYPRESFALADKLTESYFSDEADIPPLFQAQLDACGVAYFDCYLLHSLTEEFYPKFVRCRAFEAAQRLKEQGKIRHIGISFHDRAALLDRILTEQPSIEFVQIQFNYADFDDPGVQSGRCYEVCRAHGKPVMVMEPLRGGGLMRLPPKAQAVIDALGGGDAASYALRYCASFEGIAMVLSGMSSVEQMDANLRTMRDTRPLTAEEMDALAQVRGILRTAGGIRCTACRYCEPGCPQHIPIPDLFSCYNSRRTYRGWNADMYYGILTQHGGAASQCVGCGACERVCPQRLPIRRYMKDVAALMEKKRK